MVGSASARVAAIRATCSGAILPPLPRAAAHTPPAPKPRRPEDVGNAAQLSGSRAVGPARHAQAVSAGLKPEFSPRDGSCGERYFTSSRCQHCARLRPRGVTAEVLLL